MGKGRGKGKDGNKGAYIGCGACCVVVIVIVILVALGFQKLQPNQLGLDYSGNSLTLDTKKLYQAGIHFLGVGHDFIYYPKAVMEIDMRTRRDQIVGRTKDGLVISLATRLLYRLIPSNDRLAALYLMFKDEYPKAYRAITRGTVRDVASMYTAFEFWQNRDNITMQMKSELEKKLLGYHATVDSFLLSEFDLPTQFDEALTETDVWQQEQSKVVFEMEAANKDIESMLITVNQTVARIYLEANRIANTTLLEFQAEEQKIRTAVAAELQSYKYMKAELGLSSEQLVNLVWLQALKDSKGVKKTFQLGLPPSLAA